MAKGFGTALGDHLVIVSIYIYDIYYINTYLYNNTIYYIYIY